MPALQALRQAARQSVVLQYVHARVPSAEILRQQRTVPGRSFNPTAAGLEIPKTTNSA